MMEPILLIASKRDQDLGLYLLEDILGIPEVLVSDNPDDAKGTTVVMGEITSAFRIKNPVNACIMRDRKVFDDYIIVPLPGTDYLEEDPKNLEMAANSLLIMISGERNPQNQVVLVDDMFKVFDLIEYIKQVGYVSFDFETSRIVNTIHEDSLELYSVAFSFQQGSAYVVILKNSDLSAEAMEKMVKLFNDEVFGNTAVTKIAHNIKFDMHCAYRWGVREFNGPFHDTMVMSHLIDCDSSNKLKDNIRQYYPAFSNYEEDTLGHDWERIDKESLIKYNALDADLTLRLYWLFTKMMMEDDRLYNHFRNIGAPASLGLFCMERRGILIDKRALIESMDLVKGMIEDKEKSLQSFDQVISYSDHVGKPVNFNSPKQLSGLMYSKEGFEFKPHVDWKTGQPLYTTNRDVFEYIKDDTGFINSLLAYRQLKKIYSTYLEGILGKLSSDHRIRATFNQHGTRTGRLSARDPNLQNIITRTKYKEVEEAVSLVKRLFIPPLGKTLVQVDFSQAELRIVAFYADEDTMLKAYRDGLDLHSLTAASSRNITIEQFNRQNDKDRSRQRFEAKAVNFGLIYGMSSKGFKDYAKVSYGIEFTDKGAERMRDNFFKLYPRLLKYHEVYKAKARKFGYIRTFFGRRVPMPFINSMNKQKRASDERNAINYPIQGTAGEMTIMALSILHKILPKGVEIVNTVHDSILFYIPDEVLHQLVPTIKQVIENLPIETYFGKSIDTVKMTVDFETSKKSWGELKKYLHL